MVRQRNKLTARTVASISKPGMHGDGDNLWLVVTPSGTKNWVLRYTLQGKSHTMGLGPVSLISLQDARQKAQDARRLLLDGIDPIQQRKALKTAQALDGAKSITFADAALKYIDSHKSGWKNAKHAAQWQSTLETYAFPVFGKLPVGTVDVGFVIRALEPIWSDKPETASRLRGRIESVLDWAKVRGYREGENPARWKGNLDHLLPARSKVRKVKHHAALPYSEVADFLNKLRQQTGVAARAFEFAILTASRTSETLNAVWSEVDLEKKVWTIPGERMKAGQEHRVPLSDRAIEILQSVGQQFGFNPDRPVFPGQRIKKPLSNMAFLAILRRMKRTDITAHGFRSTFRDWVAEKTAYPHEVAEMALAHSVSNKVEAAYRRGDLFDKRRALMDSWARECESNVDNTKGTQ
tara:strand:+ start:197 stop:1423 length:1227 start_codon:yes stop_codon:yes gene_type:complete